MKKSIILVLLLCTSAVVDAQYYLETWVGVNKNPNSLNTDAEYPSGSGLSATWTLLLGASAAPTWSSNTSIPFSFQFNGAAVSKFKVSNSAVLTFDTASALMPSFVPTTLPTAALPDKSVCVWGIQGTGTNDFVMQKTFGTAPNRQHWIFFTSYSSAGNPANYHYFSIVLEETTNKIYIVDQRNNVTGTNPLTLGLQINATNALQVAGPNAQFQAGADFTPNDNSYYAFVPGVQSAYDFSCSAITNSSFAIIGNNNITGVLKNIGSQTITSLDLNYTVNGGTVASAPLTGLNIPSNGTYSFSHPTPWMPTTGSYTIAAYASNLNGFVDLVPANDNATKVISVLTKTIKRTPLIEVYTSSTCPPCKPGNEVLHSIIDTVIDVPVTIKFQQDFPGTGDPYATSETVNRRTGFYSIGSIPRLELDGGWDGNAGSFTYSLLSNAASVPAQFEMSGSYLLNPIYKSVSGKVRYSPAFNNPAGSTKLYIAILEKKTDNNVKSNGEVDFTQVCKKMVPSNGGTTLPALTAGTFDSTSFSYQFNGDYILPPNGSAANQVNFATQHTVEEFEDLYVIAWIQGNNKEVYQAAFLNGTFATAIGEVSKNIVDVKVYPNPTYDKINIDLSNISGKIATVLMIDTKGDIIESKQFTLKQGINSTSINVHDLPAGIYSITILDDNNNSISKQISVQH
jgi:Secretion system C-terminal sorting domain/CARDB